VTLALEAARVGQWAEWKHRESYPDLAKTPSIPGMHALGRTASVPPLRFVDENGRPYIPEILYWHAPPRLIEWGCELLRADGASPDAIERVWHLAALAVAQRSEDFEFLFSEGVRWLYNPDSEVDHLVHAKRSADAERAYRGALAAVPGSQAASVALAALLFRSDRRSEASELITSMLARHPPVADPWRSYAHADDRFWSLLITRLRGEVRR
jgi:hypothetical protein